MKNTNTLLLGIWRFRQAVAAKRLISMARSWASADRRYVGVYVRKISPNAYGVGFSYKLDSAQPEASCDRYFQMTRKRLVRAFGDDLAGWDMGGPAWVIR